MSDTGLRTFERHNSPPPVAASKGAEVFLGRRRFFSPLSRGKEGEASARREGSFLIHCAQIGKEEEEEQKNYRADHEIPHTFFKRNVVCRLIWQIIIA